MPSSNPNQPYPVIDIFAGPGGLGEGFASLGSSVDSTGRAYRIALSVEKHASAQSTLKLRHFFRHFGIGQAPDDYYAFLAGQIKLDELYTRHPDQARRASESAWQCELGAVDNDEVLQRIRQALQGDAKWVLVGGPPCQAYSLAGRSRMKDQPGFVTDHRHTLYREYLRILADHRPPVFVMENVKGLLSAQLDGTSTIDLIMQDLREPERAIYRTTDGAKYRLYSLSTGDEVTADERNATAFVVKSELYGIPQARHRIIVVGVRADLTVRPGRLIPQPTITVEQVTGDLPRLRSRISRRIDSAKRWHDELMSALSAAWFTNGTDSAITEIANSIRQSLSETDILQLETRSTKPTVPCALADWYSDGRLEALSSHEARSHMATDLHRYLFASIFTKAKGTSPKLADFPVQLLPAHKNAAGDASGEVSAFSDRFRVQRADAPATTITSHISKDGHYYIHYDPTQCRSLTVREAARLQTFPDNYHFLGSRTERYHQVGNAVPPLLSRQIAVIVQKMLEAMT